MSDWIDELARALDLEALTTRDADRILRIARDVAHRVERRDTPLASFLLGLHVARLTGAGTARSVALDGAIALADSLLPPAPHAP